MATAHVPGVFNEILHVVALPFTVHFPVTVLPLRVARIV